MVRPRNLLLSALILILLAAGARLPTQAPARNDAAGGKPDYARQRDIVYGRKFGTALTMDVFTPKKANGAAVIFVVSGGWFSAYEMIDTFGAAYVNDLTGRGYTVFAVLHGCQPKFTIPEIVQDIDRSVRFIRHHAGKFKIDPDRIGIMGGSAGGHLSLMQGLAGSKGDPAAKDPILKESSRVHAVGCFFPPTDFFNYGKEGENALGRGVLTPFKAAFDFKEFDNKTKTLVPITDEKRIEAIGRQISPITHISADDPPTLIIHGDQDKLVPIQQAEILIQKLKSVGVAAQLVTKEGVAHGWPNIAKDVATIGEWFDKHLKK